MAVVGLIILAIYQNQPKGWYIWFLLITGLVMGIAGGVMLAIALAAPCDTMLGDAYIDNTDYNAPPFTYQPIIQQSPQTVFQPILQQPVAQQPLTVTTSTPSVVLNTPPQVVQSFIIYILL